MSQRMNHGLMGAFIQNVCVCCGRMKGALGGLRGNAGKKQHLLQPSHALLCTFPPICNRLHSMLLMSSVIAVTSVGGPPLPTRWCLA